MKYKQYGKTNEEVSILGMGGMRFDKEIPEEQCIETIRYANQEAGINYFDTAPRYNEDRSEGIYGRAFKSMNRQDFLVATKGPNEFTADEILQSIEQSLKRLNIDQIDFYFLWCIIYWEQYQKTKAKGAALEGILKAKEQGLIKHIGVSTHMYSEGIKRLVDENIYEFIMIPYNALNFTQREDGLRYAKQYKLGTAVMNPLYGGVIPRFRDQINIYPTSKHSPIEDALLFCYESPYIDVVLSGMNSQQNIDENAEIANRSKPINDQELNDRQARIESAFHGMCTSCGYCMRHCPEGIPIKSYMEVYNTYVLTQDLEATRERHNWYTKFGPLQNRQRNAGDCTACSACEPECTQYLNIPERLTWIDEHFEQESR